MAQFLRTLPGLLAAAMLATVATAAEPEKLGRQMQVHKVKEVGLEIWTELEPTWETRLETPPGMRPTFAVETPASTYPPAGMSFAVPGYVISPAELPTVVKSAVRQAARNYGLSDAEIELIPLNPATYGELKGYEAQFAAVADTVPVDVRVFFGHEPGKPVVAMQVYTLRGKLPHLAEQIRRSWSHVAYLAEAP
jgi:hypothetical protein